MIGITVALAVGVGDLLKELEAPLDEGGERYVARVYGTKLDGTWEAWIEFASLRTGKLRRSEVATTAPTRDELAQWADHIEPRELHRALKDSKLSLVSDLGSPPTPAGRHAPTR